MAHLQIELTSTCEQETAGNVRQLGPELQRWPEEKKQRALQMIVHCCDIGNPAKPLAYCLQWTERIMAEMFAQVGPSTYMDTFQSAHLEFARCMGAGTHLELSDMQSLLPATAAVSNVIAPPVTCSQCDM